MRKCVSIDDANVCMEVVCSIGFSLRIHREGTACLAETVADIDYNVDSICYYFIMSCHYSSQFQSKSNQIIIKQFIQFSSFYIKTHVNQTKIYSL